VWIAGAADDPQTLIGWVAAEPARVHYTYVKKRLRGHGIARDLLEHAACDLGQFTSTSTLTRDWIREKASANGISYSPSFRGEHAEKAADRIVA
jgi:GNAT superfamily N-acetyltransferase